MMPIFLIAVVTGAFILSAIVLAWQGKYAHAIQVAGWAVANIGFLLTLR